MSTLFIDGWHLSDVGVGLGVYAARLVNALMKRRAALRAAPVILVPSSAVLPSDIPAEAVRRRTPMWLGHRLMDELVWKVQVGRLAARAGGGTALFSPAPFWALSAPARTAVTHHDCIHRRFPRYEGRRLLRRWLLRRRDRFLRRCAMVFTESEFSRRDLAEVSGADVHRIHAIPAWLPAAYEPDGARRQAPGVRVRYGLPARYWLYVGGYDYRKNLECLIEAYAAAHSRGICPPLVLAGNLPADLSQPVCDVRGALAKFGLRSSEVCLPGYVDDADMPGLYGGAELFIYPSLCEGFGLPPLEAMGCGCPALVADNSSLPEVVHDAPYRFSGTDAMALARRLERASAAPLPLNPGFRRADFNEDTCAGRYLDLLNEMTNGAR